MKNNFPFPHFVEHFVAHFVDPVDFVSAESNGIDKVDDKVLNRRTA
jgi:hypothetical protein